MYEMISDNSQLNKSMINFMFTRDRFFKYLFLSHDEDSLYLCNLLFKELLGKEYKNIVSMNTHFLAKENEKEMISDALFDVGDKIKVNIEMQNNIYDEMHTRFDMYLSKMYIEGVEKYKDAKNAIQVLFLNKQHHRLIDHCTLKDDDCITTTKSWTRITVYLKYIKKIVKKKGIDELSEFEKLIYIFAYSNIYDIIESEKRTGKRTRMVEIMERKTDDFLSLLDEKMRIFNEYHKELEERAIKERQKRMYELKVRKATKKGYKQGMQKGIEQGIEQGLEQGIIQGKQKAILNAIVHLSKNMNIAYNQAMDILNIPQDEQEKYLKLLDA